MIQMKRSPKYAGKWDKDRRNQNSYFHFNDGNYAEKDESIENFDFHKWLKEEVSYKGI